MSAPGRSRFAFRLDEALHEELRAAATRTDRSEAAVVRQALREWLAKEAGEGATGEQATGTLEGAEGASAQSARHVAEPEMGTTAMTPAVAPADPYARYDPATAALLRRVDAQLAEGDPSYRPPETARLG